jgi:osmotically-inducible protein OsmY
MPGTDTTPRSQGASSATETEAVNHGALGHLSVEEELQQAVCSALIETAELDSSHIGVRVTSEAVILSGRVKSREAWRLALKIASQQPGVAVVQADELHIAAG